MPVRREDNLDVASVPRIPVNGDIPPGVEMRVLTEDVKTGLDHLVVDYPAGWRSEARGYMTAGQDIFILEGDLTIGGYRLTTACYTYIPKGMVFDPVSTEKGCSALVFNDKAHHFVKAETSLPDAKVDQYVPCLQTWNLPWLDPMKDVIVKRSTWVDPRTGKEARPPGVLTKTLRQDPDTGAIVALTQLAAGYVDPGTEVHPHDECLYLIAGDAYIGHTYDKKKLDNKRDLVLKKDCYIARHPGIYHGPVASQNGALWLVYLSDGYTGIYGDVEDWDKLVGNYFATAPFR
jgi:hypothetical protein